MNSTTKDLNEEQAAALASGANPFGIEWANERFMAIDPDELMKTRDFSKEEQDFLIERQGMIADFNFDKPSTYLERYILYLAAIGMNNAMRDEMEEWTEKMEDLEMKARWKMILEHRANETDKELEQAKKEAQRAKKELEVARGVIKALQGRTNEKAEKKGEESSG